MSKFYLAHVCREADGNFRKHDVATHCLGVAQLAKKFALPFGSGGWAEIVGKLHDLGKYRPAFQKHIKKSSGYDPEASISSEKKPNKNHASTGACYVCDRKLGLGEQLQEMSILLAYTIAGHHAGLPNYTKDSGDGGRPLLEALKDTEFLQEALAEDVPDSLLSVGAMQPPTVISREEDLHFWVRMLFSCLIDADFLDTEAFFRPGQSKQRSSKQVSMQHLLRHFNQYMQKFSRGGVLSEVGKLRDTVLAQAREASLGKPGICTMTVPTGGGKTLSSMAFALECCRHHAKSRIIYAIPYTSIIEQTAGIFKEIFKSCGDVVLEHHSNIEPEEDKEKTYTRLAAENWDIPIIVTTTVQLFESLFANKTSRCRKLHNIANSVIVIDEAQLLPVHNLEPIRHCMEVLSKHYGVTFLLTTATPTGLRCQQDAFGRELLRGLESREIISNPSQNYLSLRNRVRYFLPEDYQVFHGWKDIADDISQHPTVLVVVNKRDDARCLYQNLSQILPESTVLFHLSALMCPKHRKHVINTIKTRLRKCQPTMVVSTQLVEAGVDFDFPVVFRSIAGLDSIVQAAGRCNREGRLVDDDGNLTEGKVIVLNPESDLPKGSLTRGYNAARSMLTDHKGSIDTPAMFREYFDRFYQSIDSLDREGVMPALKQNAGDFSIQFRSAARKFRMIDDHTFTLFVDYSTSPSEGRQVKQWLRILEQDQDGKCGWLLRKLQAYSISLYYYQRDRLLREGIIRETASGFYVLGDKGVYNGDFGLVLEDQWLSSEQSVL